MKFILLLLNFALVQASPVDTTRDSFIKDNVDPAEFEKLTPMSKKGVTTLMWFGSGFFVSDDGYFVTNNHVVDDGRADEIVIVHNRVAYYADLVARNKEKDLALLKINLFPKAVKGERSINGRVTVPYLVLADDFTVGQSIYAIGFPKVDILGYEPKVTRGIICSRTGFKGNENIFQMDAAITHGNSGGPVLDESARVVGVSCSGASDEGNYNYAINCRVLRDFLPKNVKVSIEIAHRHLRSEQIAKTGIDSIGQVLVYCSSRKMEYTSDPVKDDVARREDVNSIKQTILTARLLKIRKNWSELKKITDWLLDKGCSNEDVADMNQISREELGLDLVIIAEAGGVDVKANVKPIKGFKSLDVTCGKPVALDRHNERRDFPVEAELLYEDDAWYWKGILTTRYDWHGTKEIRVVMKHVGKKKEQ